MKYYMDLSPILNQRKMRLLLSQNQINKIKLAIASSEQVTIDSVTDQEVFDYIEDLDLAYEMAELYTPKGKNPNDIENWEYRQRSLVSKQEIADDIAGHVNPRFLGEFGTVIANNYQFVR